MIYGNGVLKAAGTYDWDSDSVCSDGCWMAFWDPTGTISIKQWKTYQETTILRRARTLVKIKISQHKWRDQVTKINALLDLLNGGKDFGSVDWKAFQKTVSEVSDGKSN
jgi:hypothetical protein